MSKTKTLFTMALLVLLGSMGAAQAQNFAEVKLFTTPADFAREGGKNEAAGSILLNTSARPAIQMGATIMLLFSVPLAADIDVTSAVSNVEGADADGVTVTGGTATVEGKAENDDDNDGNGTIELSIVEFSGAADNNNLLIQGVMLDVSGTDGPVTVTLKVTAGMDDFIRIDGPSSAMVINGIKVGVEASATAITVRTRGTGAGGVMVSLTLKESFKGAFMDGNMVTVDFSGIPKEVTLEAMVTSNPEPAVPEDNGESPAVFTDEDAYAMVGPVKGGSVTVTLGGNPLDDMLDDDRPAPASVTLGLTLIANERDDDTKISFPLIRGTVMAKASFTDPTGNIDNFEDAFTDYVTVFNIRPAQCELLFPVVTVLGAWDTAISVTNPAYFEDEMASGGLTFTFYGMGVAPATYDTTVDPIVGIGLEADGTLLPGGTYQVLANEILKAVDWGETFQGHVHLKADYTHCRGLGWVTDFMGVNQAYAAAVLALDTGAAPNN